MSTTSKHNNLSSPLCATLFSIFLSTLFGCQTANDASSIGVLKQACSEHCTPAFHNGYDYMFCDDLKPWQSARDDCTSSGMDLVTIESEEENAFIRSNIDLDVWIGANDREDEGTWLWAADGRQFWSGDQHGHPVGGLYSNWKSYTQPSDSYFKYDCAKMEGSLFDNGEWKADVCSYPKGYVCKTSCPSSPTDAASHIRYLECLSDDVSDCYAKVIGLLNFDLQSAAQMYLAELLSPAEYLAIVRDRANKGHEMQAVETLLQDVCAHDADADFVPDNTDICQNTEALKATDNTGCEITELPDAPRRVYVDYMLANMGVVYDPRCENAPTPHTPRLGNVLRMSNQPGNYVFYVSDVVNQPPDCEMRYEFTAVVTHADQRKTHSAFSLQHTHNQCDICDEDCRVSYYPPLDHHLLFKIVSADGGAAGKWSTDAESVQIQVRAMNGNGQRSPWSAAYTFNIADSPPVVCN